MCITDSAGSVCPLWLLHNMAHLNAICSPDNWCQARQNGETQGGVCRLNTRSVTPPGLARYKQAANTVDKQHVHLLCNTPGLLTWCLSKHLLAKHSPKWRKEFCKRCVYSKQLLYTIVYPWICIGFILWQGSATFRIQRANSSWKRLIVVCEELLGIGWF